MYVVTSVVAIEVPQDPDQKTVTQLPTVTNSMKHTMTGFLCTTHTHTHLFPFPLRQLCQPLISTCVGHKIAEGQLKASLSWPTGSQFVSYKHRTHLNPSVFTYPANPPHISQCALSPDTTQLRISKPDQRNPPGGALIHFFIYLDLGGLLRKSS